MTDRMYRLMLGGVLLVFLYLENSYAVYAIIVVPIIEALTNWRIPKIISSIRGVPYPPVSDTNSGADTDNLSPIRVKRHINYEAERAFRLSFSTILAISYIGFEELLWWMPWFMGFAVFGAGVSGACPLLFTMKWIGFSDHPIRKKDREPITPTHTG